jgi:xanthine dehydrogenase accessory factor
VKDLLPHIDAARTAGRRISVARIVGVEGSGPRDPGAALIVTDDGEVFGSVSGGCIESEIVQHCQQVLDGGRPRLATYGISDELAQSAGLTCGGTVHVFIEPLDWGDLYDGLRDALLAEEPVAIATAVSGCRLGTRMLVAENRGSVGSFGRERLDHAVRRDLAGRQAVGQWGTREYGDDGGMEGSAATVFMEAFSAPPKMVIFGAMDFTGALAQVAKILGFHVTVCDARSVFATSKRFPHADDIVIAWPDRFFAAIGPAGLGPRDAVCVLTHDHKFDVPAIVGALQTNAGYIGAMGSRRTTTERNERLAEAGVSAAEVERVMAPIGLDLGARTPEETAVSICAEILRLRSGRTGASLRATDAAIHVESLHRLRATSHQRR